MDNRETSNADSDSDSNYITKIQIHFDSDYLPFGFGMQLRFGLFFQENSNYNDYDADYCEVTIILMTSSVRIF